MPTEDISHSDLLDLVRTMSGRIEKLEGELRTNRKFEERLQDSEERFRQVTNTIDEVFWMTDPRKDQMLFISQAYERIWGRSCNSVIEQPLSFIESIHPEDREAVIAAFPKQKEGTYDVEYRIVRDDGGIRWIRDTVNTASRMESQGVAGEIQVSEDTYRLLGNRYEFEERGLIAVKGRDEIRAYLLKALRVA
jgi:PAS domain S-box-containing protein